eukprot:TRINITY_DN1775_c0_g10_i1.p1 TRINITY_DN1775_c0_g10~~TRINITY_DN1775_c0_g10_i1.p1  ORF type:complete len:664 (+),score=81.64 TRINITY_DN1775_c0_g10_i1:68-2059(+)
MNLALGKSWNLLGLGSRAGPRKPAWSGRKTTSLDAGSRPASPSGAGARRSKLVEPRNAWQESTRRGRSRVKIQRGCLQVFVCSGRARQCSTPRSSRSFAAYDESAHMSEEQKTPAEPAQQLPTEQEISNSVRAPELLDTSGIALVLPARETLLQDLERCRMQLDDRDAGAAVLPPMGESPTASPPHSSLLLGCPETTACRRRRWTKRSLSADTWTETTTASARSSPSWSASPGATVASEAATTLTTPTRWMFAANAQTAQATTRALHLRTASGRRRTSRAATVDVAGRRRTRLQEAQELFCEMLAPLPGKLCASTSCLQRGRTMISPSPHRPRSCLPLREVGTQACARQRSCPPLKPLNGCWEWFPGIHDAPSMKSRPTHIARTSCPSSIGCAIPIPEGLAVVTDNFELSFENASPVASIAASSQQVPSGHGSDCSPTPDVHKQSQGIAADDADFCKLLAAALAEPHTPESVVAPATRAVCSHEHISDETIHMRASIDTEFCDMLAGVHASSCSHERSVASPTRLASSRASCEQDVMKDCARASKLPELSLNTEENLIDSHTIGPLTPQSMSSQVTEAPMLPGRSLTAEDKDDSDIQDDQIRPSSSLPLASQVTAMPAPTDTQESREATSQICMQARQDFAEVMAARRRRSEQSSFSVVLPCL